VQQKLGVNCHALACAGEKENEIWEDGNIRSLGWPYLAQKSPLSHKN